MKIHVRASPATRNTQDRVRNENNHTDLHINWYRMIINLNELCRNCGILFSPIKKKFRIKIRYKVLKFITSYVGYITCNINSKTFFIKIHNLSAIFEYLKSHLAKLLSHVVHRRKFYRKQNHIRANAYIEMKKLLYRRI